MSDGPSPYAGTSPVADFGGPGGAVVLVEGQTFVLSDRTGDITLDSPHGLFVLDRRILARWELQVNGYRVEPLAVEVREPFTATFAGRGHAARGYADADLVVFRHRHVGAGLRDRIVVTNHGLVPVTILVELFCDVDFADLFAVKEGRVQTGRPRRLQLDARALRYEADERQIARTSTIRLAGAVAVEPGVASWRATLQPGATWETCVDVVSTVEGRPIEPRFTCDGDDTAALPTQRLHRWRATVPRVETDHAPFERALRRAGEDLGALRIFDAEHPDRPIVAAGAPWFMTVFGRDSLLTGWMALIADHTLAGGVLEVLARFQGDDVDPRSEEEPGKILHEMRFASSEHATLAGGNVYYGSIDATPLFVMLLGELRRWDHGSGLVDQLLPHADRAIAWIEQFGDVDGDGFVEYQRKSEVGLANQGWKDSWDAVRHADGTLAQAPIALCEVQGYVYAAYGARAHLAREAGDHATFTHCVERAAALRRRFNEDFWLDEHGTFALALDADKRPVDAVASNVGHCLWTGIVDTERAATIADRLVDDTMFSGWGIRTLASSMRAYNPVSYHNGSVWPHDNAISAAGLMRYGYVDHAHRVIAAQLDVAASYQGRLPELFAGFDRDALAVPAAYPTSCSPQAWAAAAPLLWLRTLLRLDPWASQQRLWLAPVLPSRVGRLHVEGISIGDAQLTIDIEGDDVDVAGLDGYDIVPTARPPLTSLFDDLPSG